MNAPGYPIAPAVAGLQYNSSLRLIAEDHFLEETIDGRKFRVLELNKQTGKPMRRYAIHRIENTNNLEVFKLAIWVRKRGEQLSMQGTLNQLPLLALFADEVVLEDFPDATAEIYDDVAAPHRHTSYKSGPLLPGYQDLCRMEAMVANPNSTNDPADWHEDLRAAMNEVAVEEVVEEFCGARLVVRQESFHLWLRLRNAGAIPPRCAIVGEIKAFTGSFGPKFLDLMQRWAATNGVEFHANREKQRDLARKCGSHYLAVQCLGGFLDHWAFVCYGGSSNLFSFFPFRHILLSDTFTNTQISRWLAEKRFGESGKVFPMFDPYRFVEALPVITPALIRFAGQPCA